MRPIDADALLEKIKDWIEYCSGHTDIVHGIMHDVYESVVDDIKDAPTIDAAPVRRGEWEQLVWDDEYDNRKRRSYRCRRCYKQNAVRSNFCPNCGADMRGETHGTD